MKKVGIIYILLFITLFIGVVIVSSVNLDLNHDGTINIQDLQLLASHYQGKAAYNSTFDLNGNGKVDLFDLVRLARGINPNSGGVVVITNGSAPTYNSTTDTLLYSDNMNEYTNATEMGAVNTGSPQIVPLPSPIGNGKAVNTTDIQVITGINNTGKALRMHYTGVYQDHPTLYLLNSPSTNGSQTNYFSFYARISSSVANASGGAAIKWFEAWHCVQTGYRIQWNTHWPSSNDPAKTLYGVHTVWQIYDGGGAVSDFADQPFGPYPMHNLADDQWHLYTFAYKPNSNSTAHDGFAKMWVDGKLIIDDSYDTINVTPAGGIKPWCTADAFSQLFTNDGICSLKWGSNLTTPTNPWNYDIDNFLWWTTKEILSLII